MFLNPVTKEEVCDIVNNLASKNSCGLDFINTFVIKNVISVVADPFTYIVNVSLSTGVVPNDMNIAKVIPIPKNAESENVSNYRPISILPSFSKILERVVYERLLGFLQKHNILSNYQFGFRAKHSTSHAILHFINNVVTGIDNSQHTLGIFLDFSKAFDTLNHDILLYKLNHYENSWKITRVVHQLSV